MTVSYNGWSASPNASAIGIERFRVPGTTRYIYLRRTAAPILLYCMAWWDKYVERIDQGIMDEWGYAYRLTRGASTVSCHASGTAADVQATHYPRGTANMSLVKIAKIRYMVRKVNKAAGKTLIKWGGEWSGAFKDQMHLELAPGTNATDVQRAMRALSNLPNIYQSSIRKVFAAKTVRGRWAAKVSVTRLQRQLVAKGHLKTGRFVYGYAGTPTREAYMRFEKALGNKAELNPGLRELRILAGGVYEIVPE